jgi:two-component system nitrogen regulation response regulator NtrX
MARILVIDDDASIRSALEMILRYEGHSVTLAPDGATGLATLRTDDAFDVLLCDIKMPGMDGMEVLKSAQELRSALPVIMISGHATIDVALAATRAGAWDFCEKPLDRERLLLAVRNAVSRSELAATAQRLVSTALDRHELVGASRVMAELRALIARVAPSQARVLISGENGTGKELVARQLHLLSPRSGKAFVEVNCAALPEELIENELFGHERGSYTGAQERRAGRFELAHEGTLFLDEIGDMPLSAQAKVLRALEDGRVTRVGGAESIKADCRVIAASNKNLDEEVAAGRFREDLYYRLAVVPIHVPPLRDRGDDVLELFTRFMAQFAKRSGKCPARLSLEASRWLPLQRWPGNVRELRNLAERTALLVAGESIEVADLAGHRKREIATGSLDELLQVSDLEEFRDRSEKIWLERKLREQDWNIKRTAEVIGIQRSNLYKRLEHHGLTPPNS